MRFFFFLVLALTGLWAGREYNPWREVRYGPGRVVAPGEPVQVATPERPLGTLEGYELTALAEYYITARVLSTRRYRHEPGYELVPIDVALGWGRMSDEAVLDRLDISQSFRFLFYGCHGQPPIPQGEMARHAGNVHVIPANSEVRSAVFGLRRGSVVRMSGSLVRARSPEGAIWTSSLTRDDVGPGACEVMLVRSAELITPLEQTPAL